MIFPEKNTRRLSFILAVLAMAALPAMAQFDSGTRLPLDDSAEPDTLAAADVADSLPADYDPALDTALSGPGKPPIIRRVYDYRRQLGLSLAMMGFVAVIFTTTQNWNPR